MLCAFPELFRLIQETLWRDLNFFLAKSFSEPTALFTLFLHAAVSFDNVELMLMLTMVPNHDTPRVKDSLVSLLPNESWLTYMSKDPKSQYMYSYQALGYNSIVIGDAEK